MKRLFPNAMRIRDANALVRWWNANGKPGVQYYMEPAHLHGRYPKHWKLWFVFWR